MKAAANRISTRAWPVLTGLALACLLVVEAAGQTLPRRWRWSNPAPHGANVFDSAYGKGLTVQVGERGQVLVSEDLQNWFPKDTGTTRSLRGVMFSGNRLIITGEAGTVLYADSLESFQRVDLGTGDWLEAVAASTTTLVAVGDNAAIYTSSDGASWTRESPPNGFTTWLRGVAFGGGKFVAVGESGKIITGNSAGKSWGTANSGISTHLNRVGYINGNFWAVGDSGVVLKSANGTSWSAVSNSGATNHLYSVAGTNSTVLLAGAGELRLSLNGGTTWTDELGTTKPLPAPSWTYLSALHEGSLFLLSGRTGRTLEGFTTNGTDHVWVERHTQPRIWLWDLLRTPKFYVAVGDHGTILTSGDGVAWDLELTPNDATNSVLLGVGGSTNGLVAVGGLGKLLFSPNFITNVVFTNADTTTITNPVSTVGTIWQVMNSGVSGDLRGVTWSNGLFVVTGAGGTILTSPDGTNWTSRTSPTTRFLSSVDVFPGGFVASGDGGTILISTDGSVWTPRISGVTNWLFRTRWLHDRLVAVGEEGVILTSGDGVTWTPRTSGTTNWLNHAAYVANTWYVVGNQGTVLASANTLTWTNIGTLTQKSLYGLAANETGQLVMTGVEGVIVRAQLNALMDPVKFLDFASADGEQVFLLSGKSDQRLTVQSSTNLTDWVEGVELEILDSSGTILFRQIPVTNNLPAEFFRAVTIP